jgi:lipopolysaccharide assembly protein A
MRLIIGIPLLALVVVFALSNTQPVRLGFWPTDYAIDLPLSVAVLCGMGIAFLAGGLVVWLGALGQRRRIKDAEHAVKLLEAQVAQLRGGTRPGLGR